MDKSSSMFSFLLPSLLPPLPPSSPCAAPPSAGRGSCRSPVCQWARCSRTSANRGLGSAPCRPSPSSPGREGGVDEGGREGEKEEGRETTTYLGVEDFGDFPPVAHAVGLQGCARGWSEEEEKQKKKEKKKIEEK